jgi:hypothetical protein
MPLQPRTIVLKPYEELDSSLCPGQGRKERGILLMQPSSVQSPLADKLVWFSYKERRYEAGSYDSNRRFFRWKGDDNEQQLVMWDWDNCWIDIAKPLDDEKIRLAIRSKTNRNSEYMGNKPVELRYMMGIDVNRDGLSEAPWEEESYELTSERKHLPKSAVKPRSRWVFSIDNKYWIWEWTKKGAADRNGNDGSGDSSNNNDIRLSKTYSIYRALSEGFDSLSGYARDNNIFRTEIKDTQTSSRSIIPVIYQPAVDSLNNFLREVYSSEKENPDGSQDIEVSLVFNNEQLRRFRLLDGLYRIIRELEYKRLFDVETFRIHLSKDSVAKITNDRRKKEKEEYHDGYNNEDKNVEQSDEDSYFIFQGIYSGKYDLEYDTIHEDKEETVRPIKYCFNSKNHPIMFVNTSNHAMAEYDNNHRLWKWEYVPWVKKSPIKFGNMSRKELDSRFTNLLHK